MVITLKDHGTSENLDFFGFCKEICWNGWADWAGFWNWSYPQPSMHCVRRSGYLK